MTVTSYKTERNQNGDFFFFLSMYGNLLLIICHLWRRRTFSFLFMTRKTTFTKEEILINSNSSIDIFFLIKWSCIERRVWKTPLCLWFPDIGNIFTAKTETIKKSNKNQFSFIKNKNIMHIFIKKSSKRFSRKRKTPKLIWK